MAIYGREDRGRETEEQRRLSQEQEILLLYNLCMDPSLSPFFHPTGVVIVGASSDPTKLGHSIARNMFQCGYPGGLHFVNP
jgi:hypothetical protein